MGIERVSLPRLIGAEKEKRKREWRSLHYSLAVAGSLALCMAAGRPLHYFSPFIFLSASVWLRFFGVYIRPDSPGHSPRIPLGSDALFFSSNLIALGYLKNILFSKHAYEVCPV